LTLRQELFIRKTKADDEAAWHYYLSLLPMPVNESKKVKMKNPVLRPRCKIGVKK
jgi:hypothetical protein